MRKKLQYFNHTVPLPFLWDGLRHCATLPGCVDDLNVIWGKLNQISQGTWLNDGRVSDEVLLKIHRLHRLREWNLVGDERERSEGWEKLISSEDINVVVESSSL